MEFMYEVRNGNEGEEWALQWILVYASYLLSWSWSWWSWSYNKNKWVSDHSVEIMWIVLRRDISCVRRNIPTKINEYDLHRWSPWTCSCFYAVLQFSVPQIEYPLGGSTKKGSHVYFLLIVAMVLLLWRQIVLLWRQDNIYIKE